MSDSPAVGSGSIAPSLAEARALLRDDPRAAVARVRQVLANRPGTPEAVTILQEALKALDYPDWREKAGLMARGAELDDPQLREAATQIARNQIGQAERILRPYLQEKPEHPVAMRMLAEVAARIHRHADAEDLLVRALNQAPHYSAARFDFASLLYRQNKLDETLAAVDALLGQEPDRVEYEMLRAACLSRLGRTEEARGIYEALLARHAGDASLWILYGHALRTLGQQQESVAAYRRAIDIAPTKGLAWFSLANLKTVRLDEKDVDRMLAALAGDGLADEDRIQLHFALGTATEALGHNREAFAHYLEGNRAVRSNLDYDPRKIAGYVDRSVALFDRAFFEARGGFGLEDTTPIFIFGLPRSGSTLVEQMLASHPLIEGTAELPYIPQLSSSLEKPGQSDALEGLVGLSAAQSRDLAARYLGRAGMHRRTDRPFFIDKNLANWLHVPLIRMMFPKAKLIDVRRHPLDCGLSNFRQYYPGGFPYTYSLEQFGLYYGDYVRLRRHWDAAAPGLVYRIVYEDLVDDPEAELRALLDYIGIPFDEGCLRFHENDRIVRTFSSEQVRRPINREAIERWRLFEDWLGPLKQALGPIADDEASRVAGTE
jgi:tetratricopeptide (TPR) repeat protein